MFVWFVVSTQSRKYVSRLFFVLKIYDSRQIINVKNFDSNCFV